MTLSVHLNLRLGDFSRDVTDAAYIGLERGAEHLKGAAQQLTPVESGHLRDSEDVRPDGEDGFEVYVPGPYARFQEFGPDFNPETLHHEEGQSPYLGAAAAAEGPAVVELIAQAIRDEGIFQ